MEDFSLHLGDCLESLRTMPDCSVDAVVTDPPYGLSDHKPAEVLACLSAWIAGEPYQPKGKGFMGKSWDAWVPGPEVWRECLRVLKPGGHVLAFAGTRSMDLMSMAIRLAGFELRDSIGYANDGGGAPVMSWCFGSGFPKSMDVSKAIDKAAGAEREVLSELETGWSGTLGGKGALSGLGCAPDVRRVTAPATESARQWQGWGTALKPAWEPVVLARKPLDGTVAANVLQHGTGAINVDACRVGDTVETWPASRSYQRQDPGSESKGTQPTGAAPAGRWPANLIHDGSDEVLAGFPDSNGSGPARTLKRGARQDGDGWGNGWGMADKAGALRDAGTGSAARFFYCAKASKRDRNEGCEGMPQKMGPEAGGSRSSESGVRGGYGAPRENHHPTVKPTDLMAYLVRLVTPPGGLVLDPFMGSGSTGKAAMREGFRFIGCEMSPEYLEIARARIAHELAKRQKPDDPQPDLFAA